MEKGNFCVACLRHGETPMNAEGKIIGSIDDPLNKRGIDQAYEAALHLRKCGIVWSSIISSGLRRALQTMCIIGDQLSIKQRVKDMRFNERIVGVSQGQQSNPEIIKKFLTEEIPVKGAEWHSKFSLRIRVGFNDVLCRKQNTIVVTHALPLVEITEMITGQKMDELPPHATPIIFEFTNSGTFVRIIEVQMCQQHA